MAQAAVDGLMKTAEYIAFDLATAAAALNFAKDNTHGLGIAHHALDIAQSGQEKALEVAKLPPEGLGIFFNVMVVEVKGRLSGLVSENQDLSARVVGVMGGEEVDLQIEYRLGDTSGSIKAIFEKLWDII